MNIKTKYKVGDIAFFLDGMKVFKCTIEKISIDVYSTEIININYHIIANCDSYVNFIPSISPVKENMLFDSVEEVINNIEINNKIK